MDMITLENAFGEGIFRCDSKRKVKKGVDKVIPPVVVYTHKPKEEHSDDSNL